MPPKRLIRNCFNAARHAVFRLAGQSGRDEDRGRNKRDFRLVDVVVLLEDFHFRHMLIELKARYDPKRETITLQNNDSVIRLASLITLSSKPNPPSQ